MALGKTLLRPCCLILLMSPTNGVQRMQYHISHHIPETQNRPAMLDKDDFTIQINPTSGISLSKAGYIPRISKDAMLSSLSSAAWRCRTFPARSSVMSSIMQLSSPGRFFGQVKSQTLSNTLSTVQISRKYVEETVATCGHWDDESFHSTSYRPFPISGHRRALLLGSISSS